MEINKLSLGMMFWEGGDLKIIGTPHQTMTVKDIMEMNPGLKEDDFPPLGTHVRFRFFEPINEKEC